MRDPVFLPFLRRGLARAAGPADGLHGPLPTAADISTSVQLVDSTGASVTATQPHTLAGPGDVSGFDVDQIVRYEPPAGTTDFETNYFPFVEVLAPDLPWLLTPAVPNADGALRPWLVLVVVEEGEHVRYERRPGATALLSIDADAVATELWDLRDSHAWTHVHSTVLVSQLPAAVDAGTGKVLARMVCPRLLDPGVRYRGAVVPAFDAGVAAARGLPFTGTAIGPAWDVDGGSNVELPVFATWTFSTSVEPGDFESLCNRLAPDRDGGRLGFHETRLDPGGLLPTPDPALDFRFEFAGALTDPGAAARPLAAPARSWLDEKLKTAIDLASQRTTIRVTAPRNYRPERDDPVLGPQFYGAWAAGRHSVPDRGWLRAVNLDAANRSAAGLGADVVRHGEHDFLASAWDQVGALREATTEVNRARLTAEVAVRHHRRLSELDDASLLFAAGRTKAFVPLEQKSVQAVIEASDVVPTALTTSAFYRASRESGSVGRTLSKGATVRPVSSRVLNTFLTAAGRQSAVVARVGPVASFKEPKLPDGAIIRKGEPPGPAAVKADPSAEAATAIRTGLDPARSVAAGMRERLSGVEVADDDVSTRIVVGPWFPDGLSPRLQDLSPEFLLPGIGEFGMDRVRLLEINEPFVASMLIGANHEWAREALWREFPADLGATAFASLFDRPGDPPAPGDDTDLNTDLHAFPLNRRLEGMIGGAGTGTVVLMRAELVRRFPGLIMTLLRPADGELPLTNGGQLMRDHVVAPMFRGSIDTSTIFVGFDEDPSTILDDGWWINVEEPPSGPRFGLDAARGAGAPVPPSNWEDLSVANVRAADAAATHLRFSQLGWDGTTRGTITWGKNAAHQARITFQRPFRMIFPAHVLIGGDR